MRKKMEGLDYHGIREFLIRNKTHITFKMNGPHVACIKQCQYLPIKSYKIHFVT